MSLDINKKRAYIIYKEKANAANVTKDYYINRKINWKKEHLINAQKEQYTGLELSLDKSKSYQDNIASLK